MSPHDLMPFVRQQLASNQFLSGGAVLGSLAALGASLRKKPGELWHWMRNRFFVTLNIDDNDESFVWMVNWLATQRYTKHRARSLMVLTKKITDGGDLPSARPVNSRNPDDLLPIKAPNITFVPSRGCHWLAYKKHLVIIHRGKGDGGATPAPIAGGNDNRRLVLESLTVEVLTRNRQLAMELIEDARLLAYPPQDFRTGILTFHYDWAVSSRRRPRSLESVILQGSIMDDCITAIEHFQVREAWYAEHGIPYRLGIELEGPPGSGKSSAVAALAAHFKMDLAVINLASSEMDDDKLRDALSTVPRSAMLLLEDIDCVYEGRAVGVDKRGRENKLTFSGLLNAIDGVAAAEGRIMFLTTNYHNKLDEALVRPGRVDKRFTIGAPDKGQVQRIFARFFPAASASEMQAFVGAIGDSALTSMAAIQGILIDAHDSAPEAIRLAARLAS